MFDANRIRDILLKAGKIAMKHFRVSSPAVKTDLTYVTQADLAIQAYVCKELETAYPDDSILAEEEGRKHGTSSASRIWIVDPIDGTAAFVSGLPVWGIAIGLVADAEPRGGFFFMPVTGDLFHTTPDGRLLRNGTPVRVSAPRKFDRETSLLVGSRFHRSHVVDTTYRGKIRSLGSTVAHLCYVATGAADAVLVSNVHIWDFAAGLAMLESNGGIFTYLDGAKVDLADWISGNLASVPMLGGHPESVQNFLRIIRARGE